MHYSNTRTFMIRLQSLISNKLKRAVVLFLLIFPFVVPAGGTAEQENTDNAELVPLIQHLSNLFFDGKLTVNDLQIALVGTAEQPGNKESWFINSDKYKIRVTAEAQTDGSAVNELQLYPNNIEQLELKDLESIFGDSRVFVRSVNTWVEFDSRRSKNDRKVAITAKLYAPPGNNVSPVLTVKLRLE
jgi:hypothetical protein